MIKDKNDIILHMEGINKDFGGVPVLKDITLDVHRQEILGVIGENGAGKSTLMKILSGIYQPSSGLIYLNGEPVKIESAIKARQLGISLVPQEFNLIPDLPVYENIFLGAEILKKPGVLDKISMKEKTRELLSKLSVDIDPNARIDKISVADKQMVEICKALAFHADILILDEPTTMLTTFEIDILFKLVKALRDQGMTIIYISHKLKEIKKLCDRTIVLRDGVLVFESPTESVSVLEMAQRMVGRELESVFPPKTFPANEIVFEAKDVSVPGVLENITFSLRKGEILGLAGLVGAGRTEVAETVLGLRKMTKGHFIVNGKQIRFNEPAEAIAAGISYLSEDRQGAGILTSFSVLKNVTLISLNNYCNSFVRIIDKELERKKVQEYVRSFRIKTESLDTLLENLSGGNQQKVSLVKSIDTNPKILIVDEPTRGVDVAAKHEIYHFIHELVKGGISCLFISSELEEIVGMCNRVVVMHEGRIAAILEESAINEEEIMIHATGAKEEVAS